MKWKIISYNLKVLKTKKNGFFRFEKSSYVFDIIR